MKLSIVMALLFTATSYTQADEVRKSIFGVGNSKLSECKMGDATLSFVPNSTLTKLLGEELNLKKRDLVYKATQDDQSTVMNAV
jgi:hypothetical protein